MSRSFFFRRRTLEDSHGIWEIGELLKFFLPYAEYGKRRDYQHTVDFSVLVHTPGNGDAHYRFARSHFHKKSRAAALETLVKYAELVAQAKANAFF